MKLVSAWFLLSLSMAQWVGGHLCFEARYFMEIQHQMNAAEKALAELVTQKTGVESAVRVLQEDELIPRGNFYGDFVFSKETASQKIYYVVDNQSDSIKTLVVAPGSGKNDPASTARDAKLLKGLFKKFMMPQSGLPLTPVTMHMASNFDFLTPCSYSYSPFLLRPPARA